MNIRGDSASNNHRKGYYLLRLDETLQMPPGMDEYVRNIKISKGFQRMEKEGL